MINILKKTFEDLGLSSNEIKVLLVLLQENSLRVQTIANLSRLNRTTIYGVLKSLAKKGLISSMIRGGVSEFQSIEPQLLLNYIDRKQGQLNERKDEIKGVLPELKRMRIKNDAFPHIQFFEGIEGLKQAYEDTLQNNQNRIILDFSGTDAVFNIMGKEWVDYYVKKRTRLGIKAKVIAPDSEWSYISRKKDSDLLRITKLLPKKYTYDTEINIYDDKIAVFSFSENQPIAVIIADKRISQALRTIFQYIDDTITT